MSRLQGSDQAMLVVPLRGAVTETCRASGWGTHRACVNDEGRMVCPLCTKAVVARRDAALGEAVRVIGEHDGA